MGELKMRKIVWTLHAAPVEYEQLSDAPFDREMVSGAVRLSRAHDVIEGERVTLCGLIVPGSSLGPMDEAIGVFEAEPTDRDCRRCFNVKAFGLKRRLEFIEQRRT